jgi:hypothetical protein
MTDLSAKSKAGAIAWAECRLYRRGSRAMPYLILFTMLLLLGLLVACAIT